MGRECDAIRWTAEPISELDDNPLAKCFGPDSIDFEQLLRSSDKPLPGAGKVETQECSILVRTLGGAEFSIEGLLPETTILELKRRLADRVSAPQFALKLIAGDCTLENGQTLAESDLVKPAASIVMVRCPLDQAGVARLFRELFNAITQHRAEEARRLVDQGAGFDNEGNLLKAGNDMQRPGDYIVAGGEPGNTMLHLAIREGLVDLALYLISCGVDIEATNDVGRSPLLQAVLKKQDVVAAALLAGGADVHQRDFVGNSAVTYALRQGNDALSAKLLTSGSYETLQDAFIGLDCSGLSYGRSSAVLCSCAAGMDLTAQALLAQGAPLGKPDDDGRSALHYAHGHGLSAELIGALLEAGADAEATDHNGFLPSQGIRHVQACSQTKRTPFCRSWR